MDSQELDIYIIKIKKTVDDVTAEWNQLKRESVYWKVDHKKEFRLSLEAKKGKYTTE